MLNRAMRGLCFKDDFERSSIGSNYSQAFGASFGISNGELVCTPGAGAKALLNLVGYPDVRTYGIISRMRTEAADSDVSVAAKSRQYSAEGTYDGWSHGINPGANVIENQSWANGAKTVRSSTGLTINTSTWYVINAGIQAQSFNIRAGVAEDAGLTPGDALTTTSDQDSYLETAFGPAGLLAIGGAAPGEVAWDHLALYTWWQIELAHIPSDWDVRLLNTDMAWEGVGAGGSVARIDCEGLYVPFGGFDGLEFRDENDVVQEQVTVDDGIYPGDGYVFDPPTVVSFAGATTHPRLEEPRFPDIGSDGIGVLTDDQFHRMVVFDVSDREDPRVLSHIRSPEWDARVRAVYEEARKNAYVVVDGGNKGHITSIDLDDPENPSIVNEYNVGSATGFDDEYRDVGLEGSSYLWVVADLKRSLGSFTIDDPTAVSLVLDPGVSASDLDSGWEPRGLIVEGGFLYVLCVEGLQIYEANGGGGASFRGKVATPSSSISVDNEIKHLDTVQDRLVSGHSAQDNIFLFDVSDPDNPVLRDNISIPSGWTSPRGVFIRDDRLEVNLQQGVRVYDISDPANIAFLDGVDFGKGAFGYLGAGYTAEGVAVSGFGIVEWQGLHTSETEVALSPPDKPTLTVFDVTDRTATLEGDAYSHPQGAAHADSQWQVDEVGGDFSSPVYDALSGEADEGPHQASDLPPDTSLKARVRYQDENGLWSEWSDPVSQTVEGEPFDTTDKAGELAPEGFYFGAEGGPDIWRFGHGFTDDGVAIDALVRPNPVAPAGPHGECIFRNLYLVLTYGTDVDLVVTPIVDGERLTDIQRTISLVTSTEVTERKELPLLLPYKDDGGTEQFRYAPRGTWFEVEIRVEDLLGKGPLVTLEGIVLEGQVVRESEEATVGA